MNKTDELRATLRRLPEMYGSGDFEGVKLYISLHKGKKHDDYVDHKGGSVQRLQNGGFEVTWQSDCFAQYNYHGQAMSYSAGCDDEEIAKSSRLVADFRRKHGY